MKLYWQIFIVVAVVIIKENLCVPAVRPLSQRAIIFPEDNWDDCFLDKASTQPGKCKSLEECPEILKKWNRDNLFPKTCYFIKKEQFVCCPIGMSKEAIAATKKPDTTSVTTIKKPSNIFLEIFNTDPTAFTQQPHTTPTTTATTTTTRENSTKRPFNIFLDNLNSSTQKIETTTKYSNIFLDKLTTTSKSPVGTLDILMASYEMNTKKRDDNNEMFTKSPQIITPDIFSTENFLNVTRPSELECVQHSDTWNTDGPPSKFNEFPFMAALGWKLDNFENIWYACGGVLISPAFVLTAAHCAEIEGETPLYVHLCATNLTDSAADTVKIKQIIKYPGYNKSTVYNDIALIELEREVDYPAACLWTEHNLPLTKLKSLGFRTPFGGLGPKHLRKSTYTVVDKNECQVFYEFVDKFKKIEIVDSNICASDLENLQNVCESDSGGPLIMEFNKISYVVGITSYGFGCGSLPPSVFTRVSSFIDWIEEIVWPEIDVRIEK